MAHVIAKSLSQHGITRVAVADEFLKKIVEQNSDVERIERSQHYRQWMAPGKFAKIFAWTAIKYGIELVKVSAKGTTATCAQCGAVNPPTGNRLVQCMNGACRAYDQDKNAALNLARGGDRELFGDQVSPHDGYTRASGQCHNDGSRSRLIRFNGPQGLGGQIFDIANG